MLWCQNCGSTKVKVTNLNFTKLKPEEEAAIKYSHNKDSFYCQNCEKQWESIPEAEETYLEYVSLRNKTQLVAYNVQDYKNSPLPIQNINHEELIRRHELAKKISDCYKHLLDISPKEWHELEQDNI